MTLTLAASAGLTWAVRRPAERWGPRPPLLALAGLSFLAALTLLGTRHPWLAVGAAMLGNVAVGAGETGPFLAMEQVIVARAAAGHRRTGLLAVYNLLGYAAGALGAATAAWVERPDPLFALFGAGALVQGAAYAWLSAPPPRPRTGPRAPLPSGPLIRRMAALFALDSFAGGFVLQSLLAYFLHVRFGLALADLGRVFFAAQLLTAASLLLAVPLARRLGLLPTMVASHLCSNVALMAMALAPTMEAAVALLLLRQLLSQMDVPTRQAWVMAVVEDREREAAASLTNLARTAAQTVTPGLTGWTMEAVALGAPLVLGGGLKIVYDLLLWAAFRRVPLRPDGG